jgi:predicted nucleic acid-binding protein
MFDTNIFDKILKIPNLLTDKHEYFITHIQNDELDAAPPEIKKKWLNVFQIIPHQLIPTETAIIDVSRIGMAKIGHGELYNLILSELGKKKPCASKNNRKDALIGETAIKNEIILVTEDRALRDSVKRHGGRVMSFDIFQKVITTKNV